MQAPKKKLILLLGLILCIGFMMTSLVSYFVSRSSLRYQIATSELPLTSDNIYSEIQRDLLRPVFISSLMASDTFLRDWVIGGEIDRDKMTRYLKEIRTRYNTFTSFFVSEQTKNYYYADGILKKVSPEEPRDIWYFRVRSMQSEYEINVDPDLANKDAMTIFVNHKAYDYANRYIGATGVGLTVDAVKKLTDSYQKKYNRNIFFADPAGNIVLPGAASPKNIARVQDIEGLADAVDQILSSDRRRLSYRRDGKTVHLNTRFIPQLKWYLFVEQTEERATREIFNALIINLIFCVVITAVVLLLTHLTIRAYQKKMEKMATTRKRLEGLTLEQQEEISRQMRELADKNATLEEALAEVKTLSGFLPICASCKKIRDDKGYWSQIESYISKHSSAQFSHSICPECAEKFYADVPDENDPPPENRPSDPDPETNPDRK